MRCCRIYSTDWLKLYFKSVLADFRLKIMKAFAVACLAVAVSAVTLERTDCPFCAGVDAPKVFIDSTTLDGVGLSWANSVLNTQQVAPMIKKSFFAAGSNVIPEATSLITNVGGVERIGASEYDQKLLTEGWKIGQSADTFLPSEMNVGSVIRATHLGNIPRVGASEYDQKLLTEGWKIGQSADTFLPSEMNVGSVLRAHVLPGRAQISEYDSKLLTEGWKIGKSADTFLPSEMNVGSVIRASMNLPGTSHMPIGASEYDQKLLTEGWKIGQSADTFLPADMNIRSVVRAHHMPTHSLMSDYDNKILTEAYKLGASSDTFLPREQRSFISSPITSTHLGAAVTREIATPTGVNTFVTNDINEAMRVQSEIRNKMLEHKNKMEQFRSLLESQFI